MKKKELKVLFRFVKDLDCYQTFSNVTKSDYISFGMPQEHYLEMATSDSLLSRFWTHSNVISQKCDFIALRKLFHGYINVDIVKKIQKVALFAKK